MNPAEKWAEFANRTGPKSITVENSSGPTWDGSVKGQGHEDPNWPDLIRCFFFFNFKYENIKSFFRIFHLSHS